MANKILTYLMFEGKAEEAINFYVSLFPDSEVVDLNRYEEGDLKGKLQLGYFNLNDQPFMAIDSPAVHDFTFTPAISIFVECESEEELDKVFGQLNEGGKALMPLDDYGFSKKFGWTEDKYGVSWQLNLAA
jgi:predicted 3-demethylubiquinone-9 3-methyltransferase (glyoxalase superfamily)